MKFGLDDTVVKSIQNVIAHFPEIEEVILYGSRANGNYTPGSDIDLTFTGEKLNLSIINKLSLLLDDLYLPYTFDLSVFSQIDNAALIEHIHRVGIVFYKK